jgi:8-oxo-dGTP pyrophosphatase MutT (NUDIX family)
LNLEDGRTAGNFPAVSVIVGAMNVSPSVYRVDRLELRFIPKPWAFAIERRGEIDDYFARLQREKPGIWNGRVLLMHSQVLTEGVFRGAYLETDYASFAAWCHWGRPAAAVHDCFGAAAIVTADGAFLLGVMGAHTFNAGQIYFPCGTPDPDDIVEGRVDLETSVRRELKEEAGLDIDEFSAEPGWTTVVDGALIMQVKVLRAREDADTLRARILDQLAREKQPELADIRIVRGPADFDPAMPRFVTAFLAQRFAGS